MAKEKGTLHLDFIVTSARSMSREIAEFEQGGKFEEMSNSVCTCAALSDMRKLVWRVGVHFSTQLVHPTTRVLEVVIENLTATESSTAFKIMQVKNDWVFIANDRSFTGACPLIYTGAEVRMIKLHSNE